MTKIGTTRKGRVVPVLRHRDHFTLQGQPKRGLTQAQAKNWCETYNAGMTGQEYRTSRLVAYHCPMCDQYHTGHLR